MTAAEIVKQGGFQYKGFVMTGDDNTEASVLGTGEFGRVLGLGWVASSDKLKFSVKVNVHVKKKGLRTGPDTVLADIPGQIPEKLTRRNILRIVNTIFDSLGLLTPFTIKLKMEMRELYSEENKDLGWDDVIPEHLQQKWIVLIEEMFQIEEIEFERCIKPADANETDPTLIVFDDAS